MRTDDLEVERQIDEDIEAQPSGNPDIRARLEHAALELACAYDASCPSLPAIRLAEYEVCSAARAFGGQRTYSVEEGASKALFLAAVMYWAAPGEITREDLLDTAVRHGRAMLRAA